MRYRSNRQYLHPVLRPDADDYGVDAAFFAICDTPQYDQSDGMVSISVRFDLDEPTLSQAVRSSNAKCAAMVYCGSTLYRDRLEALPSEPFIARGRIPVSRLKMRYRSVRSYWPHATLCILPTRPIPNIKDSRYQSPGWHPWLPICPGFST